MSEISHKNNSGVKKGERSSLSEEHFPDFDLIKRESLGRAKVISSLEFIANVDYFKSKSHAKQSHAATPAEDRVLDRIFYQHHSLTKKDIELIEKILKKLLFIIISI